MSECRQRAVSLRVSKEWWRETGREGPVRVRPSVIAGTSSVRCKPQRCLCQTRSTPGDPMDRTGVTQNKSSPRLEKTRARTFVEVQRKEVLSENFIFDKNFCLLQ